MPIRMLGVGPFREALDEKLDLTGLATERLRAIPRIEIVAEPQLSVVSFRYVPDDPSRDVNETNRRLLELVNARKRVHMTGTLLRGNFAIRICVLSFRTHRDRIEMCLEDLESAIDEIG